MSTADTEVYLGSAPTARGPYGPWLITAVVSVATFMEVLDITIAAVALPEIAGSLSASVEDSTWVLTGYLVATAIVLPMSGWLATAIGRKRFYMGCVAGFTVSSLACGLASNLEMLIFFRVLQGLSGAGMVPMSQAILADSFPPEKRSQAFGIFSLVVVVGPALGPTLGGWITEHWSWHWVFLINLPVGVLLLVANGLMVQDPPWVRQAREDFLAGGMRVDYIGFALTAIGLASLVLFLEEGQDADWFASSVITTTALLAVVSLTALALWEWRHEQPVVEVRLFAERGFAAANALIFLFGGLAIGSTQLLPQLAQALLGWTATTVGVALTFGAAVTVVLMPIVGNLGQKVSPTYLVAFGLLVQAWAFFYLYAGFNTNISFWGLTLARAGQLVGFPFLLIPIFSAAYARIPAAKNNQASAILNMTRSVGGSVGVALFQTALARRAQLHQQRLVADLNATDIPFQQTLAQLQTGAAQVASGADASSLAPYATVYRLVQGQARMLAYIDIFTLTAIVALLAVPVAFLLRSPDDT